MTSALDILTNEQIGALRNAGFVVIHREPTESMKKAFSAGKWPEQVDFYEGYHRMVAESIRSQNRSKS